MNDVAARRRPGRPQKSAAGAQATRDHILQHAGRLFQERGYTSVAMGDIAAAVGVTKPTLYYHFSSKDNLYAEMLIGMFGRIGGAIARVRQEQSTPADRLTALARQGLTYIPHDTHMDHMMQDVRVHLQPADAARVMAAFDQAILGEICAIMAEGIAVGALRPGDPVWLARLWFTLTDAFLTQRDSADPAGMTDPADLAHTLTQFFLHGAGVYTPERDYSFAVGG